MPFFTLVFGKTGSLLNVVVDLLMVLSIRSRSFPRLVGKLLIRVASSSWLRRRLRRWGCHSWHLTVGVHLVGTSFAYQDHVTLPDLGWILK